MGTPTFAVPVLSALMEPGYSVVGVYTRPDEAAGRGRRTAPTPVKEYATEREIAVFQPASLRNDRAQQQLETLAPDLIVVAAYGLFLPPRTLELPPLGCLNVHPSLLPRHRGPSPVASAILSGDTVTGVTVMQIDSGMDTGPVIAARETAIGAEETATDLTDRLFNLGADLLVDVLPRWARGEIHAEPQDDSRATVTRRLSREDGEIDWTLEATQLARQVRAYQPWPASFTRWNGKMLKVIEASPTQEGPARPPPPGTVLSLPEGRIAVVTGSGVLEVKRLQLEGKRPVTASEFVSGYPDFVGATMGE